MAIPWTAQPFDNTYSTQFLLCFVSFLRFIVCTLFYSYSLRRRSPLLPRLLIAAAVMALLCHGVALLRSGTDSHLMNILCRILNYLITLPLLFLLFEESGSTLLLAWCAGIATEEFAVHFVYLLLMFCGRDPRATMSFFPDSVPLRDYPLYYGIQIALYFLCVRRFGKAEPAQADRVMRHNITSLSVASAVILGILNSVTREHQFESRILYFVILQFSLAMSSFILILRSSILTQGRYRTELEMMERVLHEERKQFDSIKENMDIINMKCHDLKHQLANFEGRLTADEVKMLQQAVTIYDRSIKTGSETLDVLLYEKQLVCENEGITLSCMADGAALGFLSMSHLYSLFNNALGNAIEAVRQLPDRDMRVISLTVRREKERVVINVTNYFCGQFLNPGMTTTKEDKNRHGYGLQSMRYIVDLYGGELATSVHGEQFSLDISFPENAQEKGGRRA